MAISGGNVHLQENKEGGLDEDRISKIQMLTSVPLVIHGGSGVPIEQRKRLARETNICKFNIGTELRMAFGKAMRNAVNKDVKRFDRVSILKETHDPTVAVVRRVLSNLKGCKCLILEFLVVGVLAKCMVKLLKEWIQREL